jgi:ankyrin repeat protein
VTELADVLAIDFSATTGTPKVDKNLRWEDQEQAVLFACSSLVTIVDRRWGGPLVQFSHFSVKEFLTSDRLASSMAYRHHYIHLEPAHAIMAQACLGVLLHIDETTCKQTKDEYILANYAGEHFCEHVEFGNVLSHVTDGVDDLFDPHKPHFYLWLWLLLYHGGSSTDPNYYYRSFINRYPNNSRALLFTTWPPQIAPLHIVAQCGYLCLTRHLISKRPQDLHARDDSYRTPFHIAVLAGREELFQLFMKCSIDLGMRDSENQTLLHMAAYKGLTEVALTYLNRRWVIKDLVNAKDNAGQTALHIASRYHHPATVTLLLKFGARVDAKDNNNNTSLLLATRPLDYTQDTTRVYEITQLLLEHGASVNTRGENGHTPLHVASEYNLSSLVALLLRLGAKVDARDNDGITPLLGISGSRFYLDRRRHSPPATSDAIAEVLLEHGASVHVRDENGRTPLHLASRCNLPGIVAPLLKFGADVDARDNVQMTPLFLADRETGPLLVKHGANVHLRDVCGQTPLHMASRSLIPNLVGVLLDSGADVDAQDKCHRSPLRSTLSLWEGSSKADKTRFSQVMDLLRKHGAK